MSVEQMALVWKKEVSGNRLGMLLALADHAHDDGSNVYPSAAHLGWKIGMSERQVRTVLKELHADGTLIKEKAATPSHPTVWRLNLDNLEDKTPWAEVKEDIREKRKGKSRSEETSYQENGGRPEEIADPGRKSAVLRSETQTSDEPSLGTVNEPSSSEKETSSFSGDGQEKAAPERGPGDEKTEKTEESGAFGVRELVERVNAARERGAQIHDPVNVGNYGQFFKNRSKRHDVDTLLTALDYLVAKAAGEIESEKKAWCGFDTALDAVIAGWRPKAKLTLVDNEALERENAELEEWGRDLAKLLHEPESANG